jgi:diguanylate cyclase (GGDEF)-like protein
MCGVSARLTYAPAGFILGAAFPLCALVFAHLAGGGPTGTDFATYAAAAQAAQPLYYVLDAAPLLLAIAGFAIGGKQDRALGVATALRREVKKRSDALARVANDLEARKRLERQLAHQAFHDPLTHLANRALFTNRTEHALVRSGSKKHQVAVLMLGLDDFKTVNDMLGHDEGDNVLISVAHRLSTIVRPGDTLARIAGDEFGLLLERVVNLQDAVALAQKLIDALALPIKLRNREVRVGASVGVVCGRGDSRVDSMLRDSGLAMKEAKDKGKGCLRVFRPEIHAAILERVKLGADLQRAITNQEFFLMYQPIVDLRAKRIVGMEALVRWNHPQRGLMPPQQFIKLAEDTGAIVPLGSWVLHTACRQIKAWHGSRPGTNPLSITVNVSPIQLAHRSFIEDVHSALVTTGILPSSLILEITESALVDDRAENLALFIELKALGIRLAIDDFGTGYSSLSYLQRFPFDVLKIDKSFVDGVAGGGTDVAFARTIIALGGMLELRVLAEGIEHENQLAMLTELGCQYGQGYLFSKPVDATAMTALLDSRATNTTSLPFAVAASF